MSTSLSREDYCPTCGHTYVARYDPVRDVYRIGCPPERCDVVVEQIIGQFLADAHPISREHYTARLLRLGVPPELIPAGDHADEFTRYPST